MQGMKYEEENRAKDLYNALNQELVPLAPRVIITIEGCGVHWNCTARCEERGCSIACFSTEYLVNFEHGSLTQASGRTTQMKDVLSAVSSWLQGQELQELYARFEFVDRHKRALTTIETLVIERYPELTLCAIRNLCHLSNDLYELWFRARERSCCIFYYGENKFPNAVFHWDECQLFQIQAGRLEQLALILKRWLCDYTMPSDLQKEFPWIDVGKLARYYEEGKGIEGEFITSWDSTEQFYKEMVKASFSSEVLELIAQMRQRGYDKTLRAGTSLYSLVVSRSRRHGLRAEQPRIIFCFRGNSMDIDANFNGEAKLSCPKIGFTAEIDALLKRLETKDID